MIIAADPFGDFNATSQILRYSSLAKDVTVPRVPSGDVTATPGDVSSNLVPIEELEAATAQCEALELKLAEEETYRAGLELRLKAIEGRSLIVEQEAREEAWIEMEAQMEEERKRWQRAYTDQVRACY